MKCRKCNNESDILFNNWCANCAGLGDYEFRVQYPKDESSDLTKFEKLFEEMKVKYQVYDYAPSEPKERGFWFVVDYGNWEFDEKGKLTK